MEPEDDNNDHMRVEIFYSSIVINKQLNRRKQAVSKLEEYRRVQEVNL
jgi:hypothetical protein